MKTLALSMVALVAGFVPAAGFAATGPAFTLTTPATTAFPSTALNATSSAQTIVVTTTRAVTITSVAIPLTVNGWAEFKVGTVTGCTTDGSASTASGTACSIPVTFAPHYSGNRVQTLTITDSTGLVYTVGLTGFGNGPQSVLGPGYVYSNGVTGGGYGGDGGSPVSAKFSTVTGMVSDAVSNQYIGDYGNHNVRVIYNGGAALACLIEIEQPTLFGLTAGTTSCLGATSAPVVGDVYTIAGDVTVGTHTYVGSADAVLATATPTSNTNATLNTPSQIAVDANGNVIIADYAALKVRVVYAGGDAMACLIEVEEPTLFGLSSSATSCAGATSAPIPGYIYTLFGSGGSIPTTVPVSVTQAGDGAKATLATAGNIIGVAIDPAGDVFIADDSTSNLRTARIRVVYAGGANAAALITLENPGTTPVLGNVYRLAGGIFASTGDNTLANNGGGLLYSRGLTIDPDGNVIFTDYSTTTGTTEAKVRVIYYAGIRMASLITKENPTYPTPTPGFLYTLAGNSGNITTSTATNGDGGLASAATLTVPYGVALDPAGDIYVADYSGYNVRKISQSTGVITTVIGTGVHASATGNALTTATLWNPWGVSFGSSGTIYVTDYGVYHERYDSIVPATVNFATATPVGSVSTPQYVYLPNVGTSALTVASIVPSSGFTTTPAKSALYPDCIATLVLQPGDTCVVAVEFAPVAGSSGTISGTLTVSDNSSNIAANPHSVTLTGLAAVQTQVTLTAAPATTVDQGTNVTFTAVVAIVAGQTVPSGAAALGGTVQFNDGSTPIGCAPDDRSSDIHGADFDEHAHGRRPHDICGVHPGDDRLLSCQADADGDSGGAGLYRCDDKCRCGCDHRRHCDCAVRDHGSRRLHGEDHGDMLEPSGEHDLQHRSGAGGYGRRDVVHAGDVCGGRDDRSERFAWWYGGRGGAAWAAGAAGAGSPTPVRHDAGRVAGDGCRCGAFGLQHSATEACNGNVWRDGELH